MEEQMNRDELRGKVAKTKGRAKQATGDLTGSTRLRGQGMADEMRGKAEEAGGRARRKVGEAVQGVGKNIKRSRP
jgi:uncharacterized protein YjbJ (UPF0337 family)